MKAREAYEKYETMSPREQCIAMLAVGLNARVLDVFPDTISALATKVDAYRCEDVLTFAVGHFHTGNGMMQLIDQMASEGVHLGIDYSRTKEFPATVVTGTTGGSGTVVIENVTFADEIYDAVNRGVLLVRAEQEEAKNAE